MLQPRGSHEETEIRAVGSHLSSQLYNIFPLPGALPLGSPISGKTIKQRIDSVQLFTWTKEGAFTKSSILSKTYYLILLTFLHGKFGGNQGFICPPDSYIIQEPGFRDSSYKLLSHRSYIA